MAVKRGSSGGWYRRAHLDSRLQPHGMALRGRITTELDVNLPNKDLRKRHTICLCRRELSPEYFLPLAYSIKLGSNGKLYATSRIEHCMMI